MAETASLIQLRAVVKDYHLGARRICALRGLNLEIHQPGFYAIMGPSGSGKSTLLHLIAALDQPDSGEIIVAGQRLDSMNESQLTQFRRRRIGIVFQSFNLIPTLTALENVTLPGLLDGHTTDQREKRGGELLQLLGLSDRGAHRPDALSGGEQQRVAIARALYFSPPLLLADEPTGNLDSETSDQLWKVLEQLTSDHELTILMVTHEPAAAMHCQRVFLLRDGVINRSFDVDDSDAFELATRAH